MGRRDYKERIEVGAKYDSFYTGGRVQITQDGHFMLCCHHDCIKVVNVSSGKAEATIGAKENGELSSFVLAADDTTLAVAAKNGILEQWDFRERKKIKSWKTVGTGHVSCMAFDSTSTLLAIGGSDSTVKVWDIIEKYYTHNFKGAQGVFSVVCFYQNDSGMYVIGAANDYRIRAWSLDTRKCVATLEGHCSAVTSLQFCVDKNTLLSGGRDQVVLLWSLLDFSLLKTIPVYDSVESIILIPEGRTLPELQLKNEDLAFITVGSSGVLKVWDSTTGSCIHSKEGILSSSSQEEEEKGREQQIYAYQAFYNAAIDAISIVTSEHNVIIYKLEDFSLLKQFVGNNDQVLDIKFMGKKEEYLAVATNSCLIRIYEISTFSCQLLEGHRNIVVSLDVFPNDQNVLVSGSRDNSVLVWQMNPETGKVHCINMGYGHTHNVSAVACCKSKTNSFFSASDDKTLKLWDIPVKKRLVALKARLPVLCTVRAHDKTINSICVSLNDKFVATGSQDNTAKVWKASDLSLVGTMSGHKKGVMCVEFSPVDKVLATASKDGTVKLWSLGDFSLLKSFDDHQCPLVKVIFLSKGTQLLSSSCDGVIKLHNIKKGGCIQTETEHAGEVWALAASLNEDIMVSGASDSTIVIWKDMTEEKRTEEIGKHKDHLLKEQQLLNLIQEKKWVEAFGLAVELDQPLRTYKIVKEIMRERGGRSILCGAVTKLSADQLENLMNYVVEWNSVTKHKLPAFVILRGIAQMKSPEELLKIKNLKSNLAALISYADRNYRAVIRAEVMTSFCEFVQRNSKIVAEEDDDILSCVEQNPKKRKAEEEESPENMSKNMRCS